MKNTKVYNELNEQEIYFMLRSFNIKSKWIEMYTEHINNPDKSTMELADKYGYSISTTNKILQKCNRNMKVYVDTCGYRFVPTVDDDILILQLPTPIYNALKRYGVPSIEVLRLMDNEQLMSIRGIGVHGVNVINVHLKNLGFETNSERYKLEE